MVHPLKICQQIQSLHFSFCVFLGAYVCLTDESCRPDKCSLRVCCTSKAELQLKLDVIKCFSVIQVQRLFVILISTHRHTHSHTHHAHNHWVRMWEQKFTRGLIIIMPPFYCFRKTSLSRIPQHHSVSTHWETVLKCVLIERLEAIYFVLKYGRHFTSAFLDGLKSVSASINNLF